MSHDPANSGEQRHRPRGPEGFQAEHRSCLSLDGPVIPLNEVVEVFDLAHLDAGLGFGVVTFDRRRVGAPLLSIVIFSGAPLCPIALRKKRSASGQFSAARRDPRYHRCSHR